MSNQYYTWTPDRKLAKCDIYQAINEYGNTPALIVLNSKNEHLAGEVPDDIKVQYRAGVLTSELWLADSESVEAYSRYRQFDSAIDKAICDAGGFFCKSCLVGKPLYDILPKQLYCQVCYEFLKGEAELLNPKARKTDWIPVVKQAQAEKDTENVAGVPQDVTLIMQTSNDQKNTVSIIHPREPSETTTSKRGPKFKDLPIDLISRWAGDGMGTKSITKRLKQEFDIVVHYTTIHRLLKRRLL